MPLRKSTAETPPRKFEVLIALGSSIGNRQQTLNRAIDAIRERIGSVSAISGFYETAPWGGVAQNPFLNACIVAISFQKPMQVLESLRNIESDLGRVRDAKWQDRTIDLDVLLVRNDMDMVTCEEPILTIPHPGMLERDFVLIPAAEIAGDWIHPNSGLALSIERQNRGFHLR